MVDLSPTPAFAGLLAPVGSGRGLVVRERTHLGVAAIVVHPSPSHAVRLAAIYQQALPSGPTRVTAPAGEFLGVSPHTWLVVGDGGGALTRKLVEEFAGLAHVTDQSGAYGLLDLSGPRTLDVLAKGLPIDLDPSAFADDAVGVSEIGHIGVILWRTPEGFALLTPRSSAVSFWHWLSASAAQYGLVLG